MSVCRRTKKKSFWVAIFVLILQILGSYGEENWDDLTEEEQQKNNK